MPLQRRDLLARRQLPEVDRRIGVTPSEVGHQTACREVPAIGREGARSWWILARTAQRISLPERMSQIRTPSFSAVMICVPSGE